MCGGGGTCLCQRRYEVFYYGRVVEEAVHVGSGAVVGAYYRVSHLSCLLMCVAVGGGALVYFVALAWCAVEEEVSLACGLFGQHHGGGVEQSESGQLRYGSFHGMWISDGLSEHLVSAADADDGLAVAVRPCYGLCGAVSPQFVEVVEGGFRAGQYYDVSLFDVGGVAGVEEVYAFVALKHVEVGEVGDVAQQHHRHVHLVVGDGVGFAFQFHAVFLFYRDVVEDGHHAQHGHSADFLEHLSAFLEESDVASELVYDNALDPFPVVGCLQHDASVA